MRPLILALTFMLVQVTYATSVSASPTEPLHFEPLGQAVRVVESQLDLADDSCLLVLELDVLVAFLDWTSRGMQVPVGRVHHVQERP